MRALLRWLRPHALGLRRDPASGHLYYPVHGVRLHIRHREEAIREKYRRHAFEQIYFKHYRPTGRDCVVDIGAGLGTEIVRLAQLEPELHYVAVEIQPWIYECLCLTLAQLPPGYRPFGLAIGSGEEARIDPTRTGEDAHILEGGAVPVPMISWDEFTRRFSVDRVDLLKMNVEGAEADLLDHIDLNCVKRVIVNVHDFRADRGEGEFFRTRGRVEARLKAAGFELIEASQHWLFGRKRP